MFFEGGRIMNAIEQRFQEVGLATDPKYRFVFGPQGLPLGPTDISELTELAKVAMRFIAKADSWYRQQVVAKGGSWWAALLHSGIPQNYIPMMRGSTLPTTVMIDTIWTHKGWKIVEIDVTNRNAMGYPPLLRHLYELSCPWRGITIAWLDAGWTGVTQLMASHHRFYEPYFHFFLSSLNGVLIKEMDIPTWLGKGTADVKLLDLPILHKSHDIRGGLLELAERVQLAIPPKHHLSNKGILSLPWEVEEFEQDAVKDFLPTTRLVKRGSKFPEADFFLKLIQSGGAHGTFQNDTERLNQLVGQRRVQAVWQEALSLATRQLQFISDKDEVMTDDFVIRLSLFVTPSGEIVDADVTGSKSNIVHGSTSSVMTVPQF